MRPREWTLEELEVGTEASFERRIDDSDLDAFAWLSGDHNPLHVDQKVAQRAGYQDRVIPGVLLAALVSRLVGMELPGYKSLLLGLKLDFVTPSFPGETLRVAGRVQSIHREQRVIVLRLEITGEGELRARGTAMVRVEP